MWNIQESGSPLSDNISTIKLFIKVLKINLPCACVDATFSPELTPLSDKYLIFQTAYAYFSETICNSELITYVFYWSQVVVFEPVHLLVTVEQIIPFLS